MLRIVGIDGLPVTPRRARATRRDPLTHGTGGEVPHYVFDHEAPPVWTGPVVRRDPASYQQPSRILFWKCANAYCRQWASDQTHTPARCPYCFTPRPE
jgi:hypothetical protein